MKFSEWIKIKEQTSSTGMAAGITGIMGAKKPDPEISKFVADIVGDKTGNPKSMQQKGYQISAKLRRDAKQDALRGDLSGAFKKATDAAQMTNVAASIK